MIDYRMPKEKEYTEPITITREIDRKLDRVAHMSGLTKEMVLDILITSGCWAMKEYYKASINEVIQESGDVAANVFLQLIGREV